MAEIEDNEILEKQPEKEKESIAIIDEAPTTTIDLAEDKTEKRNENEDESKDKDRVEEDKTAEDKTEKRNENEDESKDKDRVEKDKIDDTIKDEDKIEKIEGKSDLREKSLSYSNQSNTAKDIYFNCLE